MALPRPLTLTATSRQTRSPAFGRLIILAAMFQSAGKAGATDTPPLHLPVGSWTCDGHFANGAPISAIASFALAADGAAVTSTYDDVPPGKYHAVGLFGKTKKGEPIEYVIDAFSGTRSFHGAPMPNGSNGIAYANDDGTDRFEYDFHPDSTFDIRYSVTKAGSGIWSTPCIAGKNSSAP